MVKFGKFKFKGRTVMSTPFITGIPYTFRRPANEGGGAAAGTQRGTTDLVHRYRYRYRYVMH